MYKWKPSKAKRKEFAQKMATDQTFLNAYNERKKSKADKRRLTSSFDYNTAGGEYVPTKLQHDFVFEHLELFTTKEQIQAANDVLYGYSCKEKITHDSIHIVNEIIRNFHL
jgi:hypothetical protein